MGSDGTIGYLVGKFDVLRVECARRNRFGHYRVANLVAERGSDAKLTDWISERTRDCPQKIQAGLKLLLVVDEPALATVRHRLSPRAPCAFALSPGARSETLKRKHWRAARKKKAT